MRKNGKAITTSTTAYPTPSELKPGQTAPFEITVLSPISKKVKTFSLSAESDEYSSLPKNESDKRLTIAEDKMNQFQNLLLHT